MKIAKYLTIASAIAFVIFGVYVFNYEGPLESTKMGDVFVEDGDTLGTACSKIETAIRAEGGDWSVVADGELANKTAKGSFGGGGSALFAVFTAKQFGCHCDVSKKRKVIRFVQG